MRCRLRSSRCLPFGFGAASSGIVSVESMSTCEGIMDSRADRDSRAAMAGLRSNMALQNLLGKGGGGIYLYFQLLL